MSFITIDNKRYKVTESRGYNHDIGGYVKFVLDNGTERCAVKISNVWRFRTPAERVQPLVDWIKRKDQEERNRRLEENYLKSLDNGS